MSSPGSYAKDFSASSPRGETDMLVRCFKGNALDCILPPRDGKGGLYLGNMDAALNTDLLNLFKIRAVLSVDDKFEHSYFNSKVRAAHQISAHKTLRVKDSADEDISEAVFQAIDFLELQLQRTNVLVHCFAGVSRSPTIVLAYLLRSAGCSLEQAFLYVKSKRAGIRPCGQFIDFLIKFEAALISNPASSLIRGHERLSLPNSPSCTPHRV